LGDALACKTLFVGQNFVELHSTNSTNNYLAKLVSTGIIEGTAIFAGSQTAGKGQSGTVWQSGAYENILTSVFLCPKFLQAHQQFLLSQAVALAVFDFVRLYVGVDVFIKFPNDIYHQNKKIAGILIENTVSNGYLAASVVGVGVNINQVTFDHLPNATSLACIKGGGYNIKRVLEQFYECLEARYLQLRSEKYAQISMEYTRNMLGYQENRRFVDVATGLTFEGEILGIVKGGRLAIKVGDGVRVFAHKSITFLF
jgi:BirA family biotin operon repressor/biotin-[acetyl-CoA-carboxylase] ligase